MIYSTPESIGKKLSRLGFGCMRLPKKEDGKIDRVAAGKMVDAAIENGVNYFDTAYGYHDGESELFIGEALKKHPRESFYLADKLPCWFLKEPGDPVKYFTEQLGKCQVDYFDFYLLHSLDANHWKACKETQAYQRMSEMKAAGKIKHLGFSFHGDYELFCEIIDAHEWDFVQIQINYIDYVMTESGDLYRKLLEKNIPCIVMEPVRGGYLANVPEAAEKHLKAANDNSPAQWAFRWCIDMENMPVILSGMSDMTQLEQNIATFSDDTPLTQKERDALDKARDEMLAIKTIPCTACRYCMDCSFGVDIPGAFTLYNRYKTFDEAFRTKLLYFNMGSEHTGDNCTRCGACVPKCPQGIDIPERLAEVHEVFRTLVVD